MAKYIVIKKQFGEGCDYTIGCGTRKDIVEAESIDEIMEKIALSEGKHEPYCSELTGDNELAEVLIIPFDCAITVDLEPWRQKVQDNIKEYENDQTEANERAVLERLQKKYNK